MPEEPSKPRIQPRDRRWDLRRAWQALGRLFEDPDDTAAVFEIIDALPGRSADRSFRRFAATETGARILREQRDVLDVLRDRDRLLAMPEGSLGRTYGEFMSAEQLSADGLVEASESTDGQWSENPDQERFGARLRDTHDLWHVTTGYGRDLRGEGALLAFSFAQIHTPGIGFIVAMAYWYADSEERRLIREGWLRGRRAAWLPAVDWEALLPRPIDEVREELRIGDLPDYEPEFSAKAPAAALS